MSTETHDAIMTEIQTYSEENGKFVEKGVKASATRARKALANLSKLIKARTRPTRRRSDQLNPNSIDPRLKVVGGYLKNLSLIKSIGTDGS